MKGKQHDWFTTIIHAMKHHDSYDYIRTSSRQLRILKDTTVLLVLSRPPLKQSRILNWRG